MRITRVTIIVATILSVGAALGSVSAAQRALAPEWVGSWEYVAMPLPPGETAAALAPAPRPVTPLDAPGAAASPAPDNPLTFAPRYNDRDHLHPNDAGYKAMANAVDLALITGNRPANGGRRR